MCSWERFCAFAREPERRKVGGDARITVEGVVYEVDPELAGETVVLWWGLFDRDLFVEHGERRFGPYRPSGGPIPLHRYRKHRRTARDERADRIAALATKLAVPRAALAGHPELEAAAEVRAYSAAEPALRRSGSVPGARLPLGDRGQARHRRPAGRAARAARGRGARRDRRHPGRDPRARPRAGARPGPLLGTTVGRRPVLSEVMEHYGLASPLDEAGFFETEHHRTGHQADEGGDPGRAPGRAQRRWSAPARPCWCAGSRTSSTARARCWSPGRSRSTRSGSRSRP